MRKLTGWMFLAAFVSGVLIVNVASADMSEQSELTKRHQFDMGTEFSHMTYHESEGGVTTKGMAYGLFGVYNYRSPQEFFASNLVNVYHVDVHVNYSAVDQTAQWVASGINDYIVEPRIWFGKDLMLNSNARVTPYVGVGYRYLTDQMGGHSSANGQDTFDRRQQYLYLPLGTEIAFIPAAGWEMRINGEYDYLIRGWHTSTYSQIPTPDATLKFPDITNKQMNGFGLRGSVDLIKRGDRVNFTLSPYVRYWNVRHSNTVSASNTVPSVGTATIVDSFVPNNTSTEIGARLGVQF